MSDDSRKRIVEEYLRQGQRQEAIDYIKEVYHVNESEAEKLLEAISPDVKPSATAASTSSASGCGCGGCLNVVFKIMSVFAMVFSLMFLVAFGIFYYYIEKDKAELVPLPAMIIELQESLTGKVHPVVEYDWDATTYIDTIDFAVQPSEFEVGQEIEVLIHPDVPDRAVLEMELHYDFMETLNYSSDGDDYGDLQGLEFILSGVTYFLLIPGLILFVFSIFLWWLGGRVGEKT